MKKQKKWEKQSDSKFSQLIIFKVSDKSSSNYKKFVEMTAIHMMFLKTKKYKR